MMSLARKLTRSITRSRENCKCPHCGAAAWLESLRRIKDGVATNLTVIRCRRTSGRPRCKPVTREAL